MTFFFYSPLDQMAVHANTLEDIHKKAREYIGKECLPNLKTVRTSMLTLQWEEFKAAKYRPEKIGRKDAA